MDADIEIEDEITAEMIEEGARILVMNYEVGGWSRARGMARAVYEAMSALQEVPD